jgi:hypothetical protein
VSIKRNLEPFISIPWLHGIHTNEMAYISDIEFFNHVEKKDMFTYYYSLEANIPVWRVRYSGRYIRIINPIIISMYEPNLIPCILRAGSLKDD